MELKENLKLHSDSVLLFPMIFVLRRATYVMNALIDFSNVFYNLIILIVSSLFYFVWLETVRPFWSRKLMILESFNEAMIMTLCYHMICFTDLTIIEHQLSPIQYSFLILIAFMIVVNLFSIFITAFNFEKLKGPYLMFKNKIQDLVTRLEDAFSNRKKQEIS